MTFTSIWISNVTDDLLRKTKKKKPNELQNSWTKMLLNRTNSKFSNLTLKINKLSYIFEPYSQTLGNIIEIFQNIYIYIDR